MDIKAVGQKVDELKALFLLGQRMLPFMEELFAFVGDTTPLLEEVNNAIQENLNKMPNASKQLSKVTEATEMATTEIMDIVDKITNDLFAVIDELEELKSIDEQRLANPVALLETIAASIANGKDLAALLPEINLFIDRMKNATSSEHSEIIGKTVNRLTEMTNEANSIIMSLQVQDITAQQLAAVNHLLENIQKRLSRIMQYLNSDKDEAHKELENDEHIKISKLHRAIAFDPDAVDSIGKKETRQNDIDSLMADINSGKIIDIDEEQSGETDIDSLLSSFEQEASADSKQTPAVNLENNENLEEFSQEDIDALFGNV